ALLKIEKCSNNNTNEETTCLWGIRKKYGDPVKGEVYYNPVDKKAKVCINGNTQCSGLSKVELGYFKDTQNNTHPVSYLDGKVYSSVINQDSLYTENENESEGFTPDKGGQWVKLQPDTTKNVSSTSAALIWDFPESRKGSKPEDWKKWETQNAGNIQICDRDGKGNAYNCETSNNAEGFSPITRTAADGAIVDLSDKTRKKDTLKGAGVGGAVGGFSAYQGAQDDIEARWVQASDEYDASLKNFYCGTGIKFLAEYKHDAEIPQMAEE
nr:hypothetical protein [Alphaproteobacteria bacterium]